MSDRFWDEVAPLQASGRFSVRNPGLTVMGKRGGKHVERAVFLPDEGDLVSYHTADLAELDLLDVREGVVLGDQHLAILPRFSLHSR